MWRSVAAKTAGRRLPKFGDAAGQLLHRRKPALIYQARNTLPQNVLLKRAMSGTVTPELAMTGLPSASSIRQVGWWITSCAGMVGAMVLVGGLTRLTKSGLSMTDWKVQGGLPPQNDLEWALEFEKYKQFPEYKQRANMTVDDFKFIFYWEWGHRMLGRALGVVFAVPFTYFAVRGLIPKPILPKLGLAFGMGATQGLVGWWMVKSGLTDDKAVRPAAENAQQEIRVSPYRLAAHLIMAVSTFAVLTWTALDTFALQKPKMNPSAIAREWGQVAAPLRRLRSVAMLTTGVVWCTALSGAFVAGNDAGRAYNTFPKMGDRWIPAGIMDLKPNYRNFFENTAMVQLDHRLLALSTTGLVVGNFAYAHLRGLHTMLPSNSRLAMGSLLGMVGVQVGLGISTLLLYVPIPLAATHQLGSVALLSASLWFTHSLRFVKMLK